MQRQIREGKPSVDDMRYDLAESEAVNMNVSEIIEMLLNGFEGLEDMSDEDIRYEWNSLFGDHK